MRILFEDHQYDTKDVKDVLGDFILSNLDLTKDTQLLKYVGYFYNPTIENKDHTKGDLVFILPKVLVDQEKKAFGLDPKSLIDFNWKSWKEESEKSDDETLRKRKAFDFIYGFTTWIYRAVSLYRKNQSKANNAEDEFQAEVMSSLCVGQGSKPSDATFMDIILALLDFQKTHKDFITFTIKMAHTGYNKISWPKTIAKCTPFLQGESPIYMNPVNKKKFVNFDEELFIIFYSILNYVHEEYGFPSCDQPGYKLIKGAMFKSYMEGQGKMRLRKIRYKYFSDDAVLLWNLCFAFFDKADHIQAKTNRKDFLLVRSFNCVFEAMIDELIGDKDLPEGLKNQADDKRIDHLYTYQYLIEKEENIHTDNNSQKIYHIADSKYYNRNQKLKGHDVPKQFTYARNVIQWHMNLINGLFENTEYKDIKLYDAITEGYNVIPNFFISAEVDKDLSYDIDDFQPSKLASDDDREQEQYQFKDRLFDRSTLFTIHYDVNFLYVLKKYAQNKANDKAVWKETVRNKFRTEFLKMMNDKFRFYQVCVSPNMVESFVNKYFRLLIGKVFSFVYQHELVNNGKPFRVLIYAERQVEQKNTGRDLKTCHIEQSANEYFLMIPQSSPSRSAHSFVQNVRKIELGKSDYDRIEKEGRKIVYKNLNSINFPYATNDLLEFAADPGE